MKPFFKVNKWFIFLESGIQARHYVLDLSGEDVNDDEIAWCIQKQIYGGSPK